MALSQDDRISISKKIVEIPKQNAQANTIKNQLEVEKIKAKQEDDANKQLMDDITPLVNLYQQELERYDGNGRNQLVEQDMEDSANKIINNAFFPNDPQTPLPNVPDGVWKNFQSFSNTKAVGRNFDETYTAIQNEQDIIAAINAQIAIIEAEPAVTRSTGQECVTVDTIQPDPVMQQAATDMKNEVQNWEDLANGTFAVIPTNIQDPDPTRDTQNQASRDDITNLISIIDTWQALDDFDTSHGQTTCPGFNGIDVNTLNPTKFRAAELQPIKDEITARQAFIAARIIALESSTYLGSINQNFSTGEIISTDGFYGNRYRIIETRLNLMGGSLNKLKSIERGQDAQDELVSSNNNAALAYVGVITATAFRAPAAGTGTIHVLDSSGFSISDSVFVVANDQQEISATILNIQGNTVFLDADIPKKYRQDAGARLYKVL